MEKMNFENIIESLKKRVRIYVELDSKSTNKNKNNEDVKDILSSIKTIRSYAYTLLMEKYYETDKVEINNYIKERKNIIEQKISDYLSEMDDLIIQGDYENYNKILELQDKVNDAKKRLVDLENYTNKEVFIKFISNEEKYRSKADIINDYLKENKKSFENLGLFYNDKIDTKKIDFALQILSGDKSQYNMLQDIENKELMITSLEEEKKGLSKYKDNLKEVIEEYNSYIDEYISGVQSLKRKERKYKKTLKRLPFMKHIIWRRKDKLKLSNLEQISTSLQKLISMYINNCSWIDLNFTSKGTLTDFYGEKLEWHKLFRDSIGYSYGFYDRGFYDFTENNKIPLNVLDGHNNEELIEPKNDQIHKLTMEIELLKKSIDDDYKDINISQFYYLANNPSQQNISLELETLKLIEILGDNNQYISYMLENEQDEIEKNVKVKIKDYHAQISNC